MALTVLLLGLPACNRRSPSPGGGGQIDMRWTGSGGGRLSGPATAEWCAIHRLLEIRSIRGDTGIALALYPADSLTSGRYRVRRPAQAESLRPAAGLALRWAAQTSIKGFQGESGSVLLERTGSEALSGRLVATARSVADTGRLQVSGTFTELALRPASRGCTRPPSDTLDAPAVDTLVH